MFINCHKARKIKKTPNKIFKKDSEISLTKNAAINDVINPGSAKTKAWKGFINLFFMFIATTKTDIKIKENKFKNCACFCIKPKIVVKKGINIVPPPIPIPLNTPPKKPSKIYTNAIKISPLFLIYQTTLLMPATSITITKIMLNVLLLNLLSKTEPTTPPTNTPTLKNGTYSKLSWSVVI